MRIRGERGRCGKFAEPTMKYAVTKRCEKPACKKVPKFAFEGEKKTRRC